MPDMPQSPIGQTYKILPLHCVLSDLNYAYLKVSGQIWQLNIISFRMLTILMLGFDVKASVLQRGHFLSR
jgi:hypothetical protein